MAADNLNATSVYVKTISVWIVLTCVIAYLQMVYILDIDTFEFYYFIAPIVLSSILGILTSRIILLNQRLKWVSIRDPLTSAYNYRYFKETLNDWSFENSSFSLILIDVDLFKEINDKYGHQIGDKALVRISEVLSDTKRTYDVFARHGGEEFALLTPRTDLSEAAAIAERLRGAIRAASMPADIEITCSFGVAEFRIEHDSADSLYERADKALYESKNKGRNCVSLEDSDK